MSRRLRARFDRRVLLNPVAVALDNISTLDPGDRLALNGIVHQALDQFKRGQDCPAQWCVLADALNVAEALADAGICSDEVSVERIVGAQQVLAAVQLRHGERGTWTLHAAEIRQLEDAAWVHGIQLDHCSRGEYESAVRRTAERMRQARAGNAPAGAIVVHGAIQ